MQRPDKKLEAELNKLGVYTAAKNANRATDKSVAIKINIDYPSNSVVEAPGFSVTTVSKRGTTFHFDEFEIVEHEDRKTLQFVGHQPLPEGVQYNAENAHNKVTSYVDICWLTGAEPSATAPDIMTKVTPGSTNADLGWYLPSRFLDASIDAFGKLNDVFLMGAMEEALIYGHDVSKKAGN